MASGCRAWTISARNPPTSMAGSRCRRHAMDPGPKRPRSVPTQELEATAFNPVSFAQSPRSRLGLQDARRPGGRLWLVAEVHVQLLPARALRAQLSPPALQLRRFIVAAQTVVAGAREL